MRQPGRAMHVVTTQREYKGKIYKSHLLQRSYREDGKVKHETLANLSHLPDDIVASVRAMLKGEKLVSAEAAFTPVASLPHGHVRAVLTAIERLGIPTLLSSTPGRERDLAVAMIAARALFPDSKLATTRLWQSCTLAAELGVTDATEDELYAVMDWLVERQSRIEKKLAKRHLHEGGLALYDLSSTYLEGEHADLAKLGYSRDGKRGTLQVNFGLLTAPEGQPVAVSLYPGNTNDGTTLDGQIDKLQRDFKLADICLVGDRGMFSAKQFVRIRKRNADKPESRLDWITALKSGSLRKFVADGTVQMGLFDEVDLFEFVHPDYPGERLVACHNPALAKKRAAKRQDMLRATFAELEKVRRLVARGKLQSANAIGVRVGKVLDKHNMGKHVVLEIGERSIGYAVNEATVAAEARLDGVYVIRTSLPAQRMERDEVVRTYKSLQHVERAFRTMKGVELLVRPVYHRREERIRAHLFICMLAYYVVWHLKRAWEPLMFADEDHQAKQDRDPVAPAKRSDAALAKVRTKTLPDGTPPQDYKTLLAHLAALARVRMSRRGDQAPAYTYDAEVPPNDLQRKALELVDTIVV